jgi:hypothetical protein
MANRQQGRSLIYLAWNGTVGLRSAFGGDRSTRHALAVALAIASVAGGELLGEIAHQHAHSHEVALSRWARAPTNPEGLPRGVGTPSIFAAAAS